MISGIREEVFCFFLVAVAIFIPQSTFSMSLASKKYSMKYYTTSEQRQDFKTDGFIVISGLLSAEQTTKFVEAGQVIVQRHSDPGSLYFKLAERGVMICGPSNPNMSEEERESIASVFRDVALQSKIPHVAAELMDLDPNEENVRVLRDVFLGKNIHEQKHCGWHVDDNAFWPESYQSSKSSHGINAWIAMQDMPAKYGGGLAVAPGSHTAQWRQQGYESLGFLSRETMSKDEFYKAIKEGGFLSCVLHQTNVELNDCIEAMGHVPDIKCGDVIFHTRWLFHKTSPPTDQGRLFYENNGLSCLNRYSVRYVPGTARLPIGFVNELSILSDPSNAGKQLNDVEDAWYPQVWPFVEDDIEAKMRYLLTCKIPVATKVMQTNLNELLTILNS
jgi:Phytanoyl-CoA dioxygenase (PhyH)